MSNYNNDENLATYLNLYHSEYQEIFRRLRAIAKAYNDQDIPEPGRTICLRVSDFKKAYECKINRAMGFDITWHG